MGLQKSALLALSAFTFLAGCQTAIAPVDVTRFHGAALPQRGDAIAIGAAPGLDAQSIEFRTYANGVSAALSRLGFVVVEPGKAAPLAAIIDYQTRIQRPIAPSGSPVSVGVGGSAGSYGSGVGIGVGVDLSGRPKPIITTRLAVTIRRGPSGEPLWEGRAETAAKQGTPAAQPGIAAGKLAEALFRDFPGETGATITVR
jgi:hypothetical protein